MMGEAFIISIVAGSIGCFLAFAVLPLFLSALNQTDISNVDLLMPRSVFYPSIIAFGSSVLLANFGAYFASSKAIRIAPIEVQRESNIDLKVMTAWRAVIGIFVLLGGLSMILVTWLTNVPYYGTIPLVLFGVIFLATAAAVLGAAYLPTLGYLILLPFRSFISGNFAAQSIKTSKRRTASLIAPIIISISIVVTISFIMDGMTYVFSRQAGVEPVRDGQVMFILAIPAVIFTAISIINTQIMAFSVRNTVENNHKILKIPYSDIYYFEKIKSTHKTCIVFAGGLSTFTSDLQEVLAQLDGDFIQCHKAFIANMPNVTEIQKHKTFCTLHFNNNHSCPCSMSYKKAVLSWNF